MIITIGTGRNVEDGITFSIRQQRPDLLCLIYTNHSKKTLEKVLDLLSITNDDNRLLFKENNEVNDVEVLYEQYLAYIDEVITRGFKSSEIVSDYTSGTKSMSAALVNASIAKNIGTLSYVYGQRDAEGRVISKTERVSMLSPTSIYSSNSLKLVKILFNNYQFESALKLIDDTAVHPNHNSSFKYFELLAKAYGDWDKFQFAEALESLNAADEGISAQFRVKKLIAGHKAKLHKLKKKNSEGILSHEDVSDLFSNALRRYKEGKYDDCVARLYRLVEMIGQIEFMEEFNYSTSDVPFDILTDKLKNEHKSDKKIKLGLLETYRVLHEVKSHKIASKFINQENEFKNYYLLEIALV